MSSAASASFFLKYKAHRRNIIVMERQFPDLKHADITGRAIDVFYQVYHDLGYGFLERVYANAIALASRAAGLEIVQEKQLHVMYRGAVIGQYQVDLLVNEAVIVELKACQALAAEHEAQLLNYLKASPYEVGLLFNFGPKPQHKRIVYDNARKGSLIWLRKEGH